MRELNSNLTQEWAKLNGSPFSPDDATSVAGLFLLGAATAGSVDYRAIAKATGLEHRKSSDLAKRARETGIFVGRKISGGGWLDEETGGITFICDAMVLAGLLDRAPA